MKSGIELYIHIPFCVRKCNYCDFLSMAAPAAVHESYISQLIKELTIMSAEADGREVSSVFVGGGTPSLIPADAISMIMETVRRYYDVSGSLEATIECNPGAVLRHKFAEYKRAGINRLSIGLQSADNAELKLLGRIHSFEEFLKTYQAARVEGFENINVDLINCFPMQSVRTWRKTLRNVLMLRPEHISVYNLIIEPGTYFYEMQQKGRLMMPSEDEQSEIDALTKELMQKSGYLRYEFSNWSRPGCECRHNLGYWSGTEYLGIGLGASSYAGGYRWKNTGSLDEYLGLDFDLKPEESLKLLKMNEHRLTVNECMEEFMYLGLRKTAGVSDGDFYARFARHFSDVFDAPITKYVGMGLMEMGADGRLRLTDRGIDVSNVILSDFLLDDKDKETGAAS